MSNDIQDLDNLLNRAANVPHSPQDAVQVVRPDLILERVQHEAVLVRQQIQMILSELSLIGFTEGREDSSLSSQIEDLRRQLAVSKSEALRYQREYDSSFCNSSGTYENALNAYRRAREDCERSESDGQRALGIIAKTDVELAEIRSKGYFYPNKDVIIARLNETRSAQMAYVQGAQRESEHLRECKRRLDAEDTLRTQHQSKKDDYFVNKLSPANGRVHNLEVELRNAEARKLQNTAIVATNNRNGLTRVEQERAQKNEELAERRRRLSELERFISDLVTRTLR